MTNTVVLGIDPGVNLGLAVVQRAAPGKPLAYEVIYHGTVKTDAEQSVTERLRNYGMAIVAILEKFNPGAAYCEVPWRRSRRSRHLSVFTRGHRNVGDLVLLGVITGAVIDILNVRGVPVIEVPSPTGKSAKAWEYQKEQESRGIYGGDLRKHEAVAACLALRGL